MAVIVPLVFFLADLLNGFSTEHDGFVLVRIHSPKLYLWNVPGSGDSDSGLARKKADVIIMPAILSLFGRPYRIVDYLLLAGLV